MSNREQAVARVKALAAERQQPITVAELRKASCAVSYGQQRVPQESATYIIRAANTLEAEQARLSALVEGLRTLRDEWLIPPRYAGGDIGGLLAAHRSDCANHITALLSACAVTPEYPQPTGRGGSEE